MTLATKGILRVKISSMKMRSLTVSMSHQQNF